MIQPADLPPIRVVTDGGQFRAGSVRRRVVQRAGFALMSLSAVLTVIPIVLLIAYSMGLAIPFLLAALGIGRVAELMRRHTRAVRVVSVITGVVMVIVGVLLMTGTMSRLAQFGFLVPLGL